MRVAFGLSSYDRNDYGLPPIRLENWYAEEKPQYGQARLIPRPGYALTHTASAPIRGVFQADQILTSNIAFLQGSALKRMDSLGAVADIGAVAYDEHRGQFAASQVQLVCVSGGQAHLVTDSSVQPFSWTGSTGAIGSVAEFANRHLYTERNSGRVWFSDVANASAVSAINFFTAESEPDYVEAIVAHGATIYVMGTRTVEYWAYTGNDRFPFQSRPGATLDVGLIGPDAWCKADLGVFMVARSGLIYRLQGGQPQIISTEDIARTISGLSARDQRGVKLSSYEWGNHTFVRVHLPNAATYEYDISTGTWHRPRTNGLEAHDIDDHVRAFGRVWAVGASGLGAYSASLFTEAGQSVRRVATALVPVEDGRPAVDSLTVHVSAQAPDAGTADVMLRLARDTRTFGNEMVRSIGGRGEYARPLRWGPLGRLRPPAVVAEIAITDPVGLTIGSAQINMVRP